MQTIIVYVETNVKTYLVLSQTKFCGTIPSGGELVIIYKNIIQQLKDAGYNTTIIMRERLLSQATMDALRHNKPITLKTLDTLCHLLHCQPNDIIEYVESQPAEE